MEIKFGKLKPSNTQNLFSPSLSAEQNGDNFFASSQQEQNSTQKQTGGRLNDFDSNILENNAYQVIPDEMFKLEHKMSLLESSLSKINSEIDALESLGSEIQITGLKARKKAIEEELKEINNKYSKLGISSKFSGQITSAVKTTSEKKNGTFTKASAFLSKKILSKISKKFGYSQSIKEALENLSNINLSVDELINLQTPYGETVERYEKLTAYLNKANVIHSQISKNIKNITKQSI